jgi:hypothetical protein
VQRCLPNHTHTAPYESLHRRRYQKRFNLQAELHGRREGQRISCMVKVPSAAWNDSAPARGASVPKSSGVHGNRTWGHGKNAIRHLGQCRTIAQLEQWDEARSGPDLQSYVLQTTPGAASNLSMGSPLLYIFEVPVTWVGEHRNCHWTGALQEKMQDLTQRV